MIVITIEGKEYICIFQTLGKERSYQIIDAETKDVVGEWYIDKDRLVENENIYYPIGITFFTNHPTNPMFLDISSIDDSKLLSVTHQLSSPEFDC